MYDIDSGWGTTVSIRFYVDQYLAGGRIALRMESFDTDYNDWEPYDFVSTNLPEEGLPPAVKQNAIFIRQDMNWYPSIAAVLENEGLANKTGRVGYSGFCVYDEWIVDVEKIKEVASSFRYKG